MEDLLSGLKHEKYILKNTLSFSSLMKFQKQNAFMDQIHLCLNSLHDNSFFMTGSVRLTSFVVQTLYCHAVYLLKHCMRKTIDG